MVLFCVHAKRRYLVKGETEIDTRDLALYEVFNILLIRPKNLIVKM